jgi:hypothetical protein
MTRLSIPYHDDNDGMILPCKIRRLRNSCFIRFTVNATLRWQRKQFKS